MNEFDQLLEDINQSPASNPFDQMLDQQDTVKQRAIQSSAMVAVDTQPDRRAEVMKLSERYKLAPELVENNFDTLSRKSKIESVQPDKLVRDHRGLSDWLSDPNNMALASDELDKLKDLSETINEQGDFEKLYLAMGSGFARMNSGLAKIPAMGADLYTQYAVNPMARALGYAEVGPREGLRNNAVTNFFDNAAESYTAQVPELSDKVIESALDGDFKKSSRALAFQVAANFPQLALTIGSTMAGAPGVGLAAMGGMSAASEYDEALDKGVGQSAAMANAVIAGTAEAAFERVGTIAILKKWEASIGSKLGKDTARKIMADAGKLLGVSIIQEGAEETGTSLVQDASRITTGVNPDIGRMEVASNAANAFVLGGAMGGTMVAPSGAAMGAQRSLEMRRAQELQDFYTALGDKTNELKLKKRLPEASQKLIENLTKDGPVENIFVDPKDMQTYFQSKNMDPLEAATLYGFSKEYQEAVETGTDVKIPLAKWTTTMAETEHFQGLKDDVRFSPDGLSVRENQNIEKQLKADLKLIATQEQETEIGTPEAELTPDQKRVRSARAVKENVKQQILALNSPLYGPAEAEQVALLYAKGFNSLGYRSEIDPLELFNRYGLKISLGENGQIKESFERPGDTVMAAQGKVLNQDPVPINPVDGTKSLVSPLGFISPVQSAVSQMDFREMPAKDLANRIKNLPGIKAEELEFTGILDFLSEKEGKVSRVEVEQYLKDNGVNLKQIVLAKDFQGSANEDVASETEWGEPIRDHSNDSEDINSEMEYYGSDDYWDSERVAELRSELAPDYTDENGEIDEDGLSSAVESAKETKAEELATESVESDEYPSARFTVTDEATGWSLYGSDEIGWYSSEADQNFDTDLEEAKVLLLSHMIEQGVIDGDIASFIKPKDIQWRRAVAVEAPAKSVVTRKTNALLKKDKERLLTLARERNEYMLNEGSGYTKEEYEKEVEKDAESIAREEAEESYNDPKNPKNKIKSIITHELVDGELVGNDASGYTFTIYGKPQGRGKPIIEERKLTAPSLEQAREEAIKVLLEKRIITPEGDSGQSAEEQNRPRGRTKFQKYVEPGGENYREILLTVENDGNEKFYYKNHFDQADILVHIRVTDRVDDKGRKVLVADEIQSDWHQQGRERGYRDKETAEANEKRLEEIYKELKILEPERDKFVKSKRTEANENKIKSLPQSLSISDFTDQRRIGDYTRYARPFGVSVGVQVDRFDDGEFRVTVDGMSALTTDNEAEALESAFQLTKREIKDGPIENDGLSQEDKSLLLEMDTKIAALESERSTIADSNPVPDAPFKNTEAWAGLALKRLIRLAIEQGYDAVAWMPAQTHIDRWGTDNITWAKNEEGVFLVGSVEQQGGVADGTNIEELARVRGELLERRGEKVASKEDLRKVIADTLNRERNDRSLESLTETVWKEMQEKPTGAKNPRAEGMQFFYDKVVPKTAQAIIKKLDPSAKIEVASFKTGRSDDSFVYEGPDQTVDQLELVLNNNQLDARTERQLKNVIQFMGTYGATFKRSIEENGSPELAEVFGGTLTAPEKAIQALEIPITDAMKKKSEEGISLFQSAASGFKEAQAQKKLTEILARPDAIEKYSAIPGTFEGRLIDTDIVRTMLPEYTASVEASSAYNSATHKPASSFAWKMYVEKLKSDDKRPVLLNGGGPASGKSAGVSLLPDEIIKDASVIFDGTLSVEADAIERIEMALNSDREVSIAFTYSPLEKAADRAIERFQRTGRLVPSDVMVKAHIGAVESILAISEKYKDDPRVGFYVIDNTADFSQKIISIEELRALRYIKGDETVNEAAKRLTPAIAEKLGDVEREVERRKTQEFSRLPRENEDSNPEESGFSQQAADSVDPRGRILIGADRRMKIDLFKEADLSTFLHETGHFYLEVLADLAKDPRSNPQLVADYNTAIKELGGQPGGPITVEMHEKWARAFELYLARGEAPSLELKKAFANFKVWLINIYKNLRRLDVELTPEIKGVMDRLLATDAELEAAYLGHQPLFKPDAFDGMNPETAEKYQRAIDDAKQEASESLTAKVVEREFKKREAAYKEKRKAVRARIEEEANGLRIYRALSILQKGTLPDGAALPEGTPQIKIDKQSIVQAYGKEFLERLPRPFVYAKEGGVDYNMAAEMLGFESGDAMLTEMANSQSKKAYIESRTNEEMDILYPDEVMEQFPAEAVKAAHSEGRSKLLRMELELLVQNNMPLFKDAIRRVARRVPTEAEVRDQARQIIAGKRIGEIKPYTFERAEVKAAKEAGIALAKGDIEAAFEHKRRELLNHELFRAANEAIEEHEKAIEFFKKFGQKDEDLAKSRDMDLVNAGRAILAEYDIGRSDKTRDEILKYMQAYAPESFESISALIDGVGLRPGNFDEITHEEFSKLDETVRAIWSLSRQAKNIEIDGKKVAREEIKAELIAQIDAIKKPGQRLGYDKAVSDWEKTKLRLQGMKAALRRVESWVSAVDGEFGGPFRKFIWQPIADATAIYRSEKVKVLTELQNSIKQWQKESDITTAPIKSNFGFTFAGKAELMAAILHTGNKSNLEKLLIGRGWGQILEDGTLDTSRWDEFMLTMYRTGVITKADMDFAQRVWDLNDSLKPLAQKAHKEMYGFFFNEVTADEIQTPFGNYRGGYVPAITDPIMVEDAAIRQEQEAVLKGNNSFMFPTTGRGFTKSRVEQYHAPLLLDLKLTASHIDKVLRFIHIEPRVKDVSRIVMDKKFRASLAELDPTIGQDMLVPWLQRAAQQAVSTPSKGQGGKGLDMIARELRKRAGLQAMFFNVTNTFQQVTGFSIAAVRVKPKHLRNAMWRYIQSPKAFAADVNSKSKFMETRTGTQMVEINQTIDEIALNASKFDDVRSYVQKHGYFMQSAAQNLVDLTVWAGAYEQAISEGMVEADAVRFADSSVRETQGSMAPEDISRFEAGSPFVRLFTMFQGYFNMQANLLGTEFAKTAREMGLRKGAGRLFYLYVMGFMIPAWMSELIVKGMGNGIDEDDDEQYLDDLLMSFFTSQFNTATAMFPAAGPAVRSVIAAFNDKPYDDRLSVSPVVQSIERSVQSPMSVYNAIVNDGSKRKAVRDAMSAVGMLTGIPTGVVQRPLSYLADVDEGKADPAGPVDFTRGLITGNPGTPQ